MSIKRRQVLKGALSLSALSLSYPLLRPGAAFAAEKASVVVIGGGLSGLNSALLLSDFGLDVIVLEGSQRVGGRAHTADGVETRRNTAPARSAARMRASSTCAPAWT